jgi:hypothetical protein
MNQTVVSLKRRMQRPCRVCKRRGIRRDTAYYCKKCKTPSVMGTATGCITSRKNMWKLSSSTFIEDKADDYWYTRRSRQNSRSQHCYCKGFIIQIPGASFGFWRLLWRDLPVHNLTLKKILSILNVLFQKHIIYGSN